MALMFSRLAHNFAKNGYFPTDDITLGRCLQALDTNASKVMILDPCCGEGVALAECKHHLAEMGASVSAYGIEYDKERAWHAKQLLDVVAHSDIHDMAIKTRQFGLLFLNPPYGDMTSDSIQGQARRRFEKVFFQKANPWLAFGGVMVLIVPYYVLDQEFSSWIARGYEDVRVFMAPEQKFKQCVVFGVKRKADRIDTQTVAKLVAVGSGELPPELPEHWSDPLYCIPEAGSEPPHFVAVNLNQEELVQELQTALRGGNTLWSQFDQKFKGMGHGSARPPLRNLSNWHLALALAAGQISGIVRSKSRQTLLIKGDTVKGQNRKTTIEYNGNGEPIGETLTVTDKFVPTITAIDFTPGPNYGHLVTIR